MNSKHLLKPLFFLVALAFFTSCNREFTQLQKSGTTESKYAAAIKYYNDADYFHAGLLFDEITPLLKGDSTAEKSQFYNAYCNYYQSQYQLSSYLFKTFYATYANSPYAEEAFYMYAYSMFKESPKYNLDQESTLTAIDALQTFINTFPKSQYAESCTQNLIDLRERLERKAYEKAILYYNTSGVTIANYKAAVITIDNFQREFPDSKYNEELAYTQIKSQFELAENSFFRRQHERYEKAINFHESFVDDYPSSMYGKELAKIYEEAQKDLATVIKQEEKIEALKAEAAEKRQKAAEAAKEEALLTPKLNK
ncbi:outer membrane protein assembly factor BamD [Arcticibacterium luteifluviistationis]|uniref:Outer membrane protein assembly factor BamD n=1 Tax=Arcticibacterium luteifluviistationis TaxID=1784714 RepID=A0A2Z4GBI4_9BACT|nr:outer membrane protein assembly factor BamD [Arcticibacterium luteifluviistationis]AWV98557.1 outer membrane protein assembly factor BamD [Arcticibacterium luteifluviistationis]